VVTVLQREDDGLTALLGRVPRIVIRPQPRSIRKSRSTPSITEGLVGGEAGRPRCGAMQDKL